MTFKKEIEQYLLRINTLEENFRKVQDMDTLPLSFFRAAIDILNELKTGVRNMESTQIQLMLKHLREIEEADIKETREQNIMAADLDEIVAIEEKPEIIEKKETVEQKEIVVRKEEKTPAASPVSGFLIDKIGKKIHTAFSKSLNINDRFMFQKDLFHGNIPLMNEVLSHLDSVQNLDEAISYLKGKHSIAWDSDSGIVFKESLAKHFT
jgi:hypothetical protein